MNNEEWNKAKFEKYKKAYTIAVKLGNEVFMFEGAEVVTEYAKYVIEYLQPRFNFK